MAEWYDIMAFIGLVICTLTFLVVGIISCVSSLIPVAIVAFGGFAILGTMAIFIMSEGI